MAAAEVVGTRDERVARSRRGAKERRCIVVERVGRDGGSAKGGWASRASGRREGRRSWEGELREEK